MIQSEKSLSDMARSARRHVIEMTACAKSGHPGGSLSCVDILVSLFNKMKYDPKNPEVAGRDRLILSKGHSCPALYAVLAESGFFPADELKTFRKINSRLQGHPALTLPGIEISTGSLGQGLSVGCGIALAGKLDMKDYHVYVVLGDGEVQEGQVWEAAMAAANYKLDNLTAILDRNRLQIDGFTESVMKIEPLADKWRSFGWHVIEVDGHDFKEIGNALNAVSEKPKIIIAHTTKGRGVSFMENNADFHGKAPTEEECRKALGELK